jgi:putative xylitol transport system ATP-binding protein
MKSPLLKAAGVAKSFGGVPALVDGRLTLEAGSVHALCGGNGAGKSTFLNILMGILRRDAGTIQVRDRPVDFAGPDDALRARISIITQELSPIPGMTVAENIYLGREPRRLGVVVDYPRIFATTERLLERLGFDIDPRAPMQRLSLAQTQLVEIAKAFSHDSEIIIMDEPTSAIGERETEVLFDAIRSLTAHGAGIVYVSHRLSEIFRIADQYTVFRDGRFVEHGRIAEIDRSHLVGAIVGRQLKPAEKTRRAPGAPVLQTAALGRAGEFTEISLTVHRNEVLGIYGLMGAGRSEFLNCIYGLSKPAHGEVRLVGRKLGDGNPARSIAAGLSLVTEDRKETGLVLTSSIGMNIALSAYRRMTRLSLIKGADVKALVRAMVERMRMKTSSTSLPVSSMSGGNQQKVVLARCFSTGPVCLMCDEPTRGIDEGAKQEVYHLIHEFALSGGAVLLVSSEAQEVLDVSDRIAIFKAGRLVDVIDAGRATQEELLHLAS